MDYPRPDFVRDKLQWQSLNGSWDFAFDDNDQGVAQRWFEGGIPSEIKRIITVPFVFQTELSGINEKGAHSLVWYRRMIARPQITQEQRLILHFGAVDYLATVWVYGVLAGSHQGGHTPFEMDITHLCSSGDISITVRVFDSPTDRSQPRGKQFWGPKPEDIFYTPSTGIWQTVWLEVVPDIRLGDSSHGMILRADDIDNGKLHAIIKVIGIVQDHSVVVRASLKGHQVAISDPTLIDLSGRAEVDLDLAVSDEIKARCDTAGWKDQLALWSPDHPWLYDIDLVLLQKDGSQADCVHTYIGMRRIEWTSGDGSFRLNGEPIFQALVLDQGYWPASNMTAPSADALRHDIELAKDMGFNGCRKHQKVEDPVFLYWADRLGYLVWGEMANAYEFGEMYRDRFDSEWREAVVRDRNHPCILVWTPVNESWGYPNLPTDEHQRAHIQSIYQQTKELDATRPVNDNCGWEHVHTDLSTFHDYADSGQLKKTCASVAGCLSPKSGREIFVGGAKHTAGSPIICTEFGGVNIALKPDESAPEGAWGYTTASSSEDLLVRVCNLMMAVVTGGHCCGFVYTQLTDVEQEVNGLYTFDRKAKLPAAEVKKIIDQCRQVYHSRRLIVRSS